MSAPPNPPPASEWHLTETYKALITISVEGLKILALVNGGAAVAVLTYLGNLASRSSSPVQVPGIKPALLWYCGGLLASVLAFIVAYLTQLTLYNEEIGLRRGTRLRRRHGILLAIGCGLAVFSACAFGFGCLRAAGALTPPPQLAH